VCAQVPRRLKLTFPARSAGMSRLMFAAAPTSDARHDLRGRNERLVRRVVVQHAVREGADAVGSVGQMIGELEAGEDRIRRIPPAAL